ncbi:hypothetical protein CHUAL_008688 [Chamberlinius hualienensis]
MNTGNVLPTEASGRRHASMPIERASPANCSITDTKYARQSLSAPLINNLMEHNDVSYTSSVGPVDSVEETSTSTNKDYKWRGRHDDGSGYISPYVLTDISNGKEMIVAPSPAFDHQETLYFRDGKRKIDMVLAYEDNGEFTTTAIRRRERRNYFTNNLEEEGVELEKEDKMLSQDGKTFFLKIHAPWEVLTRYAELMNFKMPIKIENDSQGEIDPVLRMIPCKASMKPFQYNKELIPDEPHYYTCAFNRERAKQFLISDRDRFFTNGQRSRIVWEILMRTRYDVGEEKIGITRLLSNGSYLAAFPLHEGNYHRKFKVPNDQLNNREILFQEWARLKCFYKSQPIPLIRKYFGEKIGIYFAWLGFYTYMLIAPAVVGAICFLYGMITLSNDIPTNDICDPEGLGNTTMCPICEKCRCRKLVESCDIAKVSYLFDNNATVFFSIFMSFWSMIFLEFWKRYQFRIAWEWDLANFEEEENASKLQEAQEVNHEPGPGDHEDNEQQCNAQDQLSTNEWQTLCNRTKATRIALTSSCILLMLSVSLGAVLGVIAYRIIMVSNLMLSNSPFISDNADWISSVTAATVNFIFIVILDKVYHKIARKLTYLEQPRTQTEYEDSFTFKMFIFQFINFYSSLIYIAFVKGRIALEDKGPVMIDQCDPTGCMFELVIQLVIIMAGKQLMNNISEIMQPVVCNWWRARKSKSKTSDVNRGLYTQWEQDYDLASLDRMALFDEYIEMVIQFGFVTLFVSAFPLAPLLAFLNNIVEIRLDAYKFVTQVRRPIATRAQDIGVWLGILKSLSILSVITNAFVLAYTSDFIPRMVYLYYYSGDGSYKDYISRSLSSYNISDSAIVQSMKHDVCWYVDHKNPPESVDKYLQTLEYWHIFAARLAFVVVYEHIVFTITGIVTYLIPDVPSDVKAKLEKEKLLAREALYEAELEKIRQEKVKRKLNADFDTNSMAEDIKDE